MTKQFEVTVVKDGKQHVEERKVVNCPDLQGDELIAFVRKDWAKYYPGETYPKIRVYGDDEPKPQPPPGALPEGVAV